MNLIALKSLPSFSLAQLTTTIIFNASKMQASSTRKTKDSAGRRLGYP